MPVYIHGGGGLTENEDKEMDFSTVFELVDDDRSNRLTTLTLIVTLLLLAFTTFDLAKLNNEVRGLVEGENTWELSFDLESMTYTETTILADGEQRQFDFEIEPGQISDGYRVGEILVTISYTETSGIPFDPPDSVYANIIQTSMEAQWSDENTTLSGSSNDASDITLKLLTYPDFDGQAQNITALNEYQALQDWVMDGFGIGTCSVSVELQTQSAPFTNDGDEEITINVEVISFKVNANRV